MLGALTHMLLSQGAVTQRTMGGRGLNVNMSSTVIAAHYTIHSWIPAQPAPSSNSYSSRKPRKSTPSPEVSFSEQLDFKF